MRSALGSALGSVLCSVVGSGLGLRVDLRVDEVDDLKALGTESAAEDGAEGAERRVERHHHEDLVSMMSVVSYGGYDECGELW